MKFSFILALLIAGISGDSSKAIAQSAGGFTATGNMTMPREGHTATLLTDGRVLITGGFPASATAELYDPATGTFAAAGRMITGRVSHAAILLSDGRVLIIGGNAGTTAELFDPITETFTPAGDMTGSWAIPILLNNGKVFIAAIPNAEIYDPATGTFTATVPYAGANPLGLSTATLLADGRVLITGCTSPCDYDVDLTELYDPATGTFTLTGAMANRSASGERTATLLTNGKVLFAGGENEDYFYASAELYDSSTGTFTATRDMTHARHAHTATLLPDGEVLITGGGIELVPPFGTYASAELYDPSSGSFSPSGNMTARRSYHRAILLNDGRVLITGGVYWDSIPGPPTGTLASADLYTPPVLTPAPVLISISGDGRGQGAVWHADTGQIASADNPAAVGEVLAMYTTSLADGGMIPPRVVIDGRLAEILFFGAAPGYSGYSQVNFRVPGGVGPGTAVSVRLSYLSRFSNEVTMGVQ